MKHRPLLLKLLSAALVFGAWEIAGRVPISYSFPTFLESMSALLAMALDGTLFVAYGETLRPLVVGVTISAVFGIGMGRIDVVVHPQSIIHSMVEFIDGSVLAQLSNTDMCFPIQYALTWPARKKAGLRPLDFPALGKLEFFAPRETDFPALRLARQAGLTGGTLPAVFNAANEVAVDAFIAGDLSFPGIWQRVEATMAAHQTRPANELDAVMEADSWARQHCRSLVAVRH